MRMCLWLRRLAVLSSGAVLATLPCGLHGGTPAWAEVRNPHGVAVIIGNRAYRNKDIPPVDYAHRDAEAFKRYVVHVLGYDPANIIDLRDATRAEMQNVLGHRTAPMNDIQARLNMLDAEGGSEVIVYYSGHGVPAEKGTPSLLPVDVAPHAAQAEGYPIELLYEKLGQLRGSKSVRVFLDTCFSGSSHGGRLVTGSPVYVVAGLPEGVGERMTVLTAVTKTQIATWDKDARHGLFTHHLLDALYGKGDRDKDGKVTAAEAKRYLDRHMTSAAWISNRRVQQATLRGVDGAVLAAAEGGSFPARPELGGGSGVPVVAKGEGGEEKAPEAGAKAATPEPVAVATPAPAGAPAVKAPDPAAAEAALGLDRDTRVLIQRGLAELKLGVGYADGLIGKKTRGAIEEWQKGKGLQVTGYLTREQAEALEAVGEKAERAAAQRAEKEKRAERERRRLAAPTPPDALTQSPSPIALALTPQPPAPDVRPPLSPLPAALSARRPGREFRDCGECPEMVVIPAGEYMMGSPDGEEGRKSDEGPRHQVRTGEGFAVGKYEVTADEFALFVWETGHDMSGGCRGYDAGEGKWKTFDDRSWGRLGFSQTGVHPVVCVSWEDPARIRHVRKCLPQKMTHVLRDTRDGRDGSTA